MKLKSEPLILIAVFGILLFLGFSGLFSSKLNHEFPQGFQANDAFYKYDRAHYLLETGNFKYQEWFVLDGRKDFTQDDSPLAYFLTAIYSLNAGIPDFDAYQFMGIIAKILAVFVMYLIIRRFNPAIALLSLGIAPFIFIKNNFISFHFGWIPITIAASILILIIWIILNLELKLMWLIFGLSVGGVLLTHLSEFYYGVLICAVMLGWLFIAGKDKAEKDMVEKDTVEKDKAEKTNLIKKSFLAIIILITAAIYILPQIINQSLSLVEDKTVVTIGTARQITFPITILSDFGFFSYIILIGVLISLYYCYQQKDKIIYFLPLYTLIAISNFPLFGMHDRFYQLRYFWPIIFMIFLGLSCYYLWGFFFKLNLLQKINNNISNNFKNIILIVFTFVIIFLSINFYYTPASPNSLIVNKEMWEGIQWVQTNIPENSNNDNNNNNSNKQENSILIVHGDSYQNTNGGVFLMFGRIVHQIKDEDYYAKLNTGQVAKTYTIRKFIHGYDYVKRSGFFTFEPVKLGKPEWEQTRGWEERNFCDFEYYVIDKLSRIPQVSQYNLKIRETLLNSNRGNFKEVFSNEWYSILKNNNIGVDCLGK